ncbi:hypothetical protein NW762_014403 [Fusarium torreyae]|uniref:Apple domain-containing protein n=1 Tax=Fusarium torreyae TaxID=1237075 RepID=A0A9W8RM54_9HYPO|nr:hypothetical protein NW762_014403 [Fusarium torreyae]
MVAVKSVLLFLALGAEALAATTSSVTCFTKLGTSSIATNKIPRATTTVTERITVVKKITRKVNVVVIPRPRTTTETETTKTTTTVRADPDVETATETVTDEQTTNIDRTITTTSTTVSTTVTTRTSTTTIDAPAGFTGLLDAPDYRAKIKARAPSSPRVNLLKAPAQQYPQRIDCTKRIPIISTKTVSTTVQGSRKTLQAKTKTKTTTSVQTIVETSYPPKVTETETETVSPTTTIYNDVTVEAVATETVTVETVVPENFYAACGSDNILRTANGGHGLRNLITKSISYGVETVASIQGQYNCCVACFQRPACFFGYTVIGNAGCNLYSATLGSAAVCPNGQARWADYYTNPNQSPTYEFSNGPCGSMGNIGDQ